MSLISDIAGSKRPRSDFDGEDSSVEQSFPFMDLPDPARFIVLRELELPEILKVCLVSTTLKDEALDNQVWRHTANSLGCSHLLREGESIFEQVKRIILEFRKRAAGLTETKLTTFEAIHQIEMYLRARSNWSIAPDIMQLLPEQVYLTRCNCSKCETSTPSDHDSKVIHMAQLLGKWCEANKEKLATAPLDENGNPVVVDTFTFDLSNRDLICMPYALFFLRRVEALNLSQNRIAFVPKAICNLSALKDLNLSGNHFTSFPEALRSLTQLVALNISNNRIPSIPQWIGNFNKLERFQFFNNPIIELPEEFLKIVKNEDFDLHPNNNLLILWWLSIAKRLNCPLEERRSKPISDQVISFLWEFCDRVNAIVDRPADINQRLESFTIDEINYVQNWLSARETLVFWDALAKAISDQNPGLNSVSSGLEHLNESKEFFDRASEFPKWCEVNQQALAQLTSLDLSGKQLYALPKEMGYLTKLQELNLSDNFLKALPAEFSTLRELLRLNLNRNWFRFVPSQVFDLTQLQELHICGAIKFIDYQICNLLELRILEHILGESADWVYDNLPKLVKPTQDMFPA